MKKFFSVLLTLSLLLSVCGAFAEDTVQIGIIVPYTGNIALYGENMYKGATLAAEEINANGGILGGKMIEIVKFDDQNDQNQTVEGFNQLVRQGIEVIIGPLSSGNTAAITSKANDEEIVLVTCTATGDALDTEDNFVFRCCYLDSYQGAIGAAFCYLNNYKKVGAIYCASDTYSKGLFDSFATACDKYGVEIVATESTPSFDYTEYTNQFKKMIDAGAELVYTPYYYDVIGPYLVNQARSAGFTGVILGADGFDGTDGYVVPGSNMDDFNNVYWNNHFFAGASEEKVSSFVTRYGTAYNNETPNALSALPYDAVYMIADAMNRAGATDAESVREALSDSSVVYDLVTGSFTLDESGAPMKSATMLEFYHDPESDTVQTRMLSVIDELPAVSE